MIRKLITIAAAIAIPVSAITALGAVVGTGVASARAEPPTSITCAESGTVALPRPGLTHDGSLTSKATETTKVTIGGTGTGCDTHASKPKIITDTTPCAGAMSPPPICTPGNPRDPNYYDDAQGYASSASSGVGSALPIETEDNGTKIWLEFGTSNSSSTCGANQGFTLTGNVDNVTQTVVLGTYTDNICVTGDTGPNTTNNFAVDLFDDIGGPPNNQSTITGLVLGGDADSSLVITIP
jgi:hypothetical protein